MCSVLPHVDLHRSYSKSCTQLEHHNWASQLNGAWRSGQCAMQRPHMPGKWIHTTASRGWSSSWWRDCRGTHSPVTLSSPVTSLVFTQAKQSHGWHYMKKWGRSPLSSWRLERGSPSPGPCCSSTGQGGVGRSWRGWEKGGLTSTGNIHPTFATRATLMQSHYTRCIRHRHNGHIVTPTSSLRLCQ